MPTLTPMMAVAAAARCRCSKTRCLKLYCDCLRGGRVCDPASCRCLNCLNTASESGPAGVRTATIRDILARRPDAFGERVRDPNAGCKCKNAR